MGMILLFLMVKSDMFYVVETTVPLVGISEAEGMALAWGCTLGFGQNYSSSIIRAKDCRSNIFCQSRIVFLCKVWSA